MNKKVFVYLIALLAIFERVFFDFGPNMELVTLTMVASHFVFGTQRSILLTFALLIVTDVLIGNSNIAIFTWSGFLLPIIFFSIFRNKSRVVAGTLMALTFNLFFFLWTNFGVWYLDGWGMYSDDLSGLVNSYTNGLPFLKIHMLNTLLTVPLGVWALGHVEKFSFSSKFYPLPTD